LQNTDDAIRLFSLGMQLHKLPLLNQLIIYELFMNRTLILIKSKHFIYYVKKFRYIIHDYFRIKHHLFRNSIFVRNELDGI